jgi:phage terminase large subunit-like protein
VEPKGNAILITKAVSGTAKIDPLMAMFDAVAVMSKCPETKQSGWQTDEPADLLRKIAAATAALNV